MTKNRGSAIVFVIGVLTILTILITSMMQNKTQRAQFTRFMSNENKAEIIAEAALDMAMASVRLSVNDHEKSDKIYTLTRRPLTLTDGRFSKGGKNAIFTVGSNNPEPLSNLASEIESKIKVLYPGETIESLLIEATLIRAEAFGDHDNESYEVADVSVKVEEGNSDLFNILDANPSRDPWRLPIRFPHNEIALPGSVKKDSKTINVPVVFEVDLGVFEVDVDVTSFDVTIHLENTVTDNGNRSIIVPSIELDGLLEALFDDSVDDIVDKVFDGGINIEEIILEKSNFANDSTNDDELTELSSKALQNQIIMDASDDFAEADFEIQAGTWSDTNIETIEKGGVIQLKCTVVYAPHTNEGSKKITRIMVAEIPFKTTDVQPIAPEYTFFIANSSLIANGAGSIMEVLEEKITLDGDGDDSDSGSILNLGEHFMIRNLPGITAFNGETSYANVTKETPSGRLRVNGEVYPIKTHMGGLEGNNGAKYTELNSMCTPNNGQNSLFRVALTYSWDGEEDPESYFHFPIFFNNANGAIEPVKTSGIEGLSDVFTPNNISDIFTRPTHLYGMGHMEYPSGLKIEATLKAMVSSITVKIVPEVEITIPFNIEDNSQVLCSIENISEIDGEPIIYGMPEMDHGLGRELDMTWESPTDYSFMPPNCFTETQYIKKATRYYESNADFWADAETDIEDNGLLDKSDNNSIRIDGVYYIKGDLIIKDPVIFKGNGLLIAQGIKITTDVKLLENSDSSLGLIARTGALEISGEGMSNEVHVQAACFSNLAPILTNVFIQGNLVVNEFKRSDIHNVQVAYDSNTTSAGGADSMKRATGKLEPRRYYVSFADNWSRTYYEKN